MSLVDVYQGLLSSDAELEKQAQQEAVTEVTTDLEGAEELAKVAMEYDAAGRQLAHVHFSEFMKAAQDEEGEEGKEEGKEHEKKETKEEEKKEEEAKAKAKGLPPALAAAMAEKKASIKQRMREDPEFAQQMFNTYC